MTAPDIHIPDEALEAAAKALFNFAMEYPYLGTRDTNNGWKDAMGHDVREAVKEKFRAQARAACLAMLRAWPGMWHRDWTTVEVPKPCLILPLPQEPQDAES